MKNSKICSKCEISKKSNEYYVAATKLISSDGRVPICKECFIGIVDFQSRASVIEALRAINRPFLQETYERILTGEQNNMGEYMRQVAMPQNRKLDFGHSVFNEDKSTQRDEERLNNDVIDIDENDKEFLISFWGRGFEDEQYEFLQTEYERYLHSYEVDSRAMEIVLQEACHQRMRIADARANGESVDRELKTLQDLFATANIKPQQETGADASDQVTFGTMIKKFEDEHPIPEPSEEWQDVDNIGKYIKTFFLGHLKRMLGSRDAQTKEATKEIQKYGVTHKDLGDDDGLI